MRYSVVVRGAAAPSGVIAPDHVSEPNQPAAEEPRVCQSLTKAGEPCKGTPGDDGYCAAHKPKEDDGAGPVGADQAEGEEAGADPEGDG